jgi:hypothetical protein
MRTRRLILAPALAAALIAGLTFGSSSPAYAASTSLTADAEAGTLAGFGDTLNTTATTSAANTGTYGYRVDTTAAGGYLNWTATDVEQGHNWAAVTAMVRVNSHAASESTDLITIKNNNGVNHFDLFLTPDNRFKWDLLISDNAQTAPITLGTWHQLEARVYFGSTTYTAQVRIDGVDQASITSTGQVATTARSIWYGTSNAKTHQIDYDNLAAQVADTDPGWLTPTSTTPPTVATNCSALTLRATINPQGTSTDVYFQYGKTTAYGSTTPTQTINGTTPQVVSAPINPAGTTTYYRAVATNAGGTTNGVMKTETCS